MTAQNQNPDQTADQPVRTNIETTRTESTDNVDSSRSVARPRGSASRGGGGGRRGWSPRRLALGALIFGAGALLFAGVNVSAQDAMHDWVHDRVTVELENLENGIEVTLLSEDEDVLVFVREMAERGMAGEFPGHGHQGDFDVTLILERVEHSIEEIDGGIRFTVTSDDELVVEMLQHRLAQHAEGGWGRHHR